MKEHAPSLHDKIKYLPAAGYDLNLHQAFQGEIQLGVTITMQMLCEKLIRTQSKECQNTINRVANLLNRTIEKNGIDSGIRFLDILEEKVPERKMTICHLKNVQVSPQAVVHALSNAMRDQCRVTPEFDDFLSRYEENL
jgi:hypothetical protein